MVQLTMIWNSLLPNLELFSLHEMARYIFCQIVLEEGILLQMFTGLSAGTATNDKISFLHDAKKI